MILENVHGNYSGKNDLPKPTNHEGECPSYLQLREEANTWVNNGLGMHFQEFTFPKSQKHAFKKWVTSQIRI